MYHSLTSLVLHDMRDESLIGIADLVSGEKDPRNLMLIFSMLKVIMVEWDIAKHVEARRTLAFSAKLKLTVIDALRLSLPLLSHNFPAAAK